MGGRQADADECYQFAEIGAVQDEEGNRGVCQNAWEGFWIIASEAGSPLFFPRKTLCWVTHLEAMNLHKRRAFLPPHLLCQDHASPAEVALVLRVLQPLVSVQLPTGSSSSLPAPAPCTMRVKPPCLLSLQPAGTETPGRSCTVCQRCGWET